MIDFLLQDPLFAFKHVSSLNLNIFDVQGCSCKKKTNQLRFHVYDLNSLTIYKNEIHITEIKTANIASKTLKPVFSSSKNTNVSAAVINIAPQIGIL